MKPDVYRERGILSGSQNEETQSDYLRRTLLDLISHPDMMTPAGLYCAHASFSLNAKLDTALLLGKSTPSQISAGVLELFKGYQIKLITERIEERFGFSYPIVVVVADETCIDGKYDDDVLHGQWGSVFGDWIEGNNPIFGVCRGRNTWAVLMREKGRVAMVSITEFSRSLEHELSHAATRAYFLQVLEAAPQTDISISQMLGAGVWEALASFPLLNLSHYLLRKRYTNLGETPRDYPAERFIDGIPGWMSDYIWTIIFRNIGDQEYDAIHLDPLFDDRWVNGVDIFLKTARQILKSNQHFILEKPSAWLTMETLSQLGIDLNIMYQEVLRISEDSLCGILRWGIKEIFWKTDLATQEKLQKEWSTCLPNWTLLNGKTTDIFRFVADGRIERASIK
jgi:hypothetical protein